MLFDRMLKIPAGENPHLEKAALYYALRDLKTSKIFKEDGIENENGLLQTYDGNPKHMVWVSFSTIQEFCEENNLEYFPGEDPKTGMDMCIVSKRKEP